MKYKPSVRHELFDPALAAILPDIDAVFTEHDSLCTMTSGHEGDPTDGVHRRDSKHYLVNCPHGGRAADFRMKHLNMDTMASIGEQVKRRVGKDYDVVVEVTNKMGHPRNHLHAEYDPK